MGRRVRGRVDRRGRFDQLIAPHVDRLLAFARRLTREEDDAADVVQETAVRAWRSLDGLEDERRARAWLFRIAYAVAMEDARARARRRTLVDVVRLEERHERLVASADTGPLEAMLASATAREVEDALESIPEEFARAVELHDLHDLKYREIAEVLGVPLGTVTSRIDRGRRLLAAVLAGERAIAGHGAAGRGLEEGSPSP